MSTSSRPAAFGGLLRRVARATNRLAVPLAGHRWFPLWAIVRHRGRRSGRMYATPVAARRTPDGFVVSLAFGREADWLRNLLAAGEGAIRWKGSEYAVANPEIIGWSAASNAFSPLQRVLVRASRMHDFVKLHDA
jgi:deazaflavin-dependent oxidoreductase (nitroreductase family)